MRFLAGLLHIRSMVRSMEPVLCSIYINIFIQIPICIYACSSCLKAPPCSTCVPACKALKPRAQAADRAETTQAEDKEAQRDQTSTLGWSDKNCLGSIELRVYSSPIQGRPEEAPTVPSRAPNSQMVPVTVPLSLASLHLI